MYDCSIVGPTNPPNRMSFWINLPGYASPLSVITQSIWLVLEIGTIIFLIWPFPCFHRPFSTFPFSSKLKLKIYPYTALFMYCILFPSLHLLFFNTFFILLSLLLLSVYAKILSDLNLIHLFLVYHTSTIWIFLYNFCSNVYP